MKNFKKSLFKYLCFVLATILFYMQMPWLQLKAYADEVAKENKAVEQVLDEDKKTSVSNSSFSSSLPENYNTPAYDNLYENSINDFSYNLPEGDFVSPENVNDGIEDYIDNEEKDDVPEIIYPSYDFLTEEESENGLIGARILTEDGYYVQKNIYDNSYSIVGYLGSDKHITVPTKYLDFPITRIYDYAFNDSKSLMSVVIPESI
ncbi:MAG: hypothetical protein MJ066_05805, partial [Clostridia bacterium]|nr:hypothetical protein [Clostridia bacterium]